MVLISRVAQWWQQSHPSDLRHLQSRKAGVRPSRISVEMWPTTLTIQEGRGPPVTHLSGDVTCDTYNPGRQGSARYASQWRCWGAQSWAGSRAPVHMLYPRSYRGGEEPEGWFPVHHLTRCATYRDGSWGSGEGGETAYRPDVPVWARITQITLWGQGSRLPVWACEMLGLSC